MSYLYEYPHPMDRVHQQTSQQDPARDYVHGYHAQQEQSPDYPTVVTLSSLPSTTNTEGMLSTSRNQALPEEPQEETEKDLEEGNEMDEIFRLCRLHRWSTIARLVSERPYLATTPIVMGNNITTTVLHQVITSKNSNTTERAKLISHILRIAPQAATLKNGYGSLPIHGLGQRNIKMDSNKKEQLIRELIRVYPESVTKAGGVGKRTLLHIIFTDYYSPSLTLDLIRLAPGVCRVKDKQGYLPAHVACSRHCSPQKLRMLLDVYPEALFDQTNDGQTLLKLAEETSTKSHPNRSLIDEIQKQLEFRSGRVAPPSTLGVQLRRRPTQPIPIPSTRNIVSRKTRSTLLVPDQMIYRTPEVVFDDGYNVRNLKNSFETHLGRQQRHGPIADYTQESDRVVPRRLYHPQASAPFLQSFYPHASNPNMDLLSPRPLQQQQHQQQWQWQQPPQQQTQCVTTPTKQSYVRGLDGYCPDAPRRKSRRSVVPMIRKATTKSPVVTSSSHPPTPPYKRQKQEESFSIEVETTTPEQRSGIGSTCSSPAHLLLHFSRRSSDNASPLFTGTYCSNNDNNDFVPKNITEI